ncbi:MAG: NHLP family bacteriocin export ABC transporter permease/ATPase subunit, partial [Oscillospiraceae bacterium]
MGWFDEQIKQRKQNDNDVFADTFINMAGAVMGKKLSQALNDDRIVTKDAIDEILKFYHVKTRDVPSEIKDMNDTLEYLLRPYGIMRRNVVLSDGWYKDAVGAMLTTMKEDGRIVALIPTGLSGYSFFDYKTGRKKKVNRKNQKLFDEEAIAFYKPFPLKELGVSGLMKYIIGTLCPADFVTIGIAALVVALLGMFIPRLNNIIFGTVITSGSNQLFFAITAFLVCVTIG